MAIRAIAAVSHVGRVRPTNQDSGYAGHNLFIVADGMGGHAGGDVASAIAVQRLAGLDQGFTSTIEARLMIANAVAETHRDINLTVREHPELSGMGTTLTALAVDDDSVAVSHIGDSRLYLLRGDELSLITTDHTFVQRLVDAGRITEDEAMVHPRRSVLMRVLGDVDAEPELDTLILDTRPGDRWLLCSDGLSGVVSFPEIRKLLRGDSVKLVADALVRAALDAGAPDNVTVIVLEMGEPPAPARPPLIVGSASAPVASALRGPVRASRGLRMPTPFTPTVHDAHFEPAGDAYLDELIAEDGRRQMRRRIAWASALTALVALLAGGLYGGYAWTQTRYFVGQQAGLVAVFRGVQQSLGPISLSNPVEVTSIPVASLPSYDAGLVSNTISAGSLDEAHAIVNRLAGHLDGAGLTGPATPSPSASATPTPAGPTPSPSASLRAVKKK